MPSTPLCDAMRLIVSSISACERCGRGAGAAEGAQRRASGVSGGGGGGGSGGEAGGEWRCGGGADGRNQNQFVAHESPSSSPQRPRCTHHFCNLRASSTAR
jgi:hypothetical protein